MERLERLAINTSFSIHSVAEGSEVISEADEILEVHNLQHTGTRALQTSDYDEALRCYEEALEIDENNIPSLCGRAEVYLYLGKYVLAQLDAERVLAVMPKHSQALTLQGHALGYLGYYREALVAFLKALDLENSSDEMSAELTNHIANMAAKYCPMPDKLVQKLPSMETYKKLCEVGASLHQARRYDLCIRVLHAAQKLETNQTGITMKVLITLANAHTALKHTELSITLYQECLATAHAAHDIPYQTKSLVSIASLFLEQGDTHQAIMYYEKLNDLQSELQGERPDGPLPDYWSKDLQCALHLNMSISYKSIGNLKQAMKHAEIYLKLIEGRDILRDNAEALSQQNIGVLLDILGKYSDALEHFKKFLELSSSKSDKKGVTQAYGCLGGVYAKLGNISLAKTYHEQCVNAAKSLLDDKLVTLAHEQFGDTGVYLGDLELAIEQYLLMFKSCSRSDPQSQTKALCKVGKAYRTQKRYQYSIYYFEQAKVIADDFKLSSIRSICEYHLACIMQHSTQMKDLDLARKYLTSLIPMLESKIVQHRDEDTFCSDDLLEELHECYHAMLAVLCKISENSLALSYAEASKWGQEGNTSPGFCGIVPVGSTGGGFKLWDTERINRLVSQQNATILYYSVLGDSYIVWVLQPGRGVVRFYQSRSQDMTYRFTDVVRSEVNKMKISGRDLTGNDLDYENRSVPYRDEDLNVIRRKFKKLQSCDHVGESHLGKPDVGNLKTGKPEVEKSDDTRAKNERSMSTQSASVPGQVLFKLLLAPVYDVLTDLEDGSPLVVVPDGCLFDCPFGAMKDWNGCYLADRFTISYVSSLYVLERVSRNEIDLLRLVDQHDFERGQSRLGGIQRILHSSQNAPGDPNSPRMPLVCEDTVSSVDMNTVNLKRTSNPRLITSGAVSSMATGNQVRSREATFLSSRTKNSDSTGIMPNKRDGTLTSVPAPPKTARLPGPGSPTSIERVIGIDSLNTLTQKTATNTDIVSSSCRVMDFKQLGDKDRCVVIGNPALPHKVELHGREWRPSIELSAAHSECLRVADLCDVAPITAKQATKERFLKEIKTATLLHIATRSCHREGYLVFSPNDGCHGDGPPTESSYIVTSAEISALQISTKLVVLSGGWAVTDKPISHQAHRLASAFIAAGAQCVLSVLWAVPNQTLLKFYHHFYTSLQTGNKVAAALREATLVLKEDEKYSSISNWSPWQLVGKDTYIDLLQMRHAQLDQDLNRIEHEVADTCTKAKLNPDPVIPNVANKEENLQSLQGYVSALLVPNKHGEEIISALVDLLDSALRRILTSEKNRPAVQLVRCVAKHEGAMGLLRLLDFHFQSCGSALTEPYVIFPHWNKDELLLPAFDIVRALHDIILNPVCASAVKEMFPLPQDLVSHMVDMLTITKNAPDIQLKVSDLSVRPLWSEVKIRNTLHAIGFQQIGLLLKFNNVPSNRRLLAASLQLMIAMSIHKNPVLLHKLDINMLGVPTNSNKNSSVSLELRRLPSLQPILLPRQQIKMSTPWLSVAEKEEEMEEKMKLTRCKTDLSREYRSHMMRAKTWHQDTVAAQANEKLDAVGRPTPKLLKVKVIRGSSMSSNNTPVDHQMSLSKVETDQRRDYSAYVLQRRLDDLALRRRNEERRLYLPYIVNA